MGQIKSKRAHKTKDLVTHVMVLVSGTTDPGNIDNDGSRALSYGTAPTGYWDEDFIDGLNAFDEEHKNFVVMSAHGWTGDNRIRNRNIAGEYIINRLCGAGGEKAYYEKKDKPIHFHFMGHSHGGNVMHEMTKHMDKLGDKWPPKWQIKSMIYLSTPFFEKLHQVKVTKKTFLENAEVFHAYNKYDLTQNVIADFSLEGLAGGLSELDTSELNEFIKTFSNLAKDLPIEALTKREDWTTGLYMNHQEGLELYTKTIALMEPIHKIIEEIKNIINQLNQEYTYKINTQIQNTNKEKPTNKRKLLQDTQANQIRAILDRFINDIDFVKVNLENNIEDVKINKDFSKKQYIEALLKGQLANNLINVLDTNPISTNSIWNILSNVLNSNIEIFDNTYVKPDIQYKNTQLADKIEGFSVSNKDKYDKSIGSKNYIKFINALKGIEKTFLNPPTNNNILELLFILIANDDKVNAILPKLPEYINTINKVEWIVTGNTDDNLKAIKVLVSELNIFFTNINFGGIADERHILTEEEIDDDILRRGSLMYLMQESHSTSRRILHQEVKDFLIRIGIEV